MSSSTTSRHRDKYHDHKKERSPERNHKPSRRSGRSRDRKSKSSERKDRSIDRRDRSRNKKDRSKDTASRDHSRKPRDEQNRKRRDSSESRSRERRKNKTKKSQKEEKPTDSKKSKPSKKTKHRSSSSSSNSSESSSSTGSSSGSVSDSSSSNSELLLLEKLQKERQRQMEEKKRQKMIQKATETPEEKRLRRLLKKQAKERKRKELMGWDSEYLHYTNSDNPFGDANLLATFSWKKKMDKDGLTNVPTSELEARNRHKQEESRRELEKVKQRRLERELEKQKREEEMYMLQRNKEAAQFEEWERQEDKFHLEQARLRSQIRIQDGRAKPIDLLAKYINAEEEVDAVEMHEPYMYLNGLEISDLEDLIEDIEVYKELEKGKNLDYWNDITVIVEDELHKLRKQSLKDEMEVAVGRREGIHQSVAKDVTDVFKGKTAVQLEALQKQIETKISGKCDGIDVSYWESLLSQLKAQMARARLHDRHQANLLQKLELLKAEQNDDVEIKQEVEVKTEVIENEGSQEAGCSTTEVNTDAGEKSDNESQSDVEEINPVDSILSEAFDDYEKGGYSPKYLQITDLEPATIVISEEDDFKRLDFKRLQVLAKSNVTVEKSKEDIVMRREAQKGMGGDEAEFSVEMGLDSQIYLWSDKYRPRKPRYFNRVHTGFEWNKYNQTHYDMDNPPPKIVQGYKFNIFYPDLIDKNSTPAYYLTPCPDNHDFAVLRFHAGPPYEDIAFKIVNREWEYSYKRGFRCQFHNNIFQLWFHFKRYRYRR